MSFIPAAPGGESRAPHTSRPCSARCGGGGDGDGLWERWLGPAPSHRRQPAAWDELHVDLAPSRGISPPSLVWLFLPKISTPSWSSRSLRERDEGKKGISSVFHHLWLTVASAQPTQTTARGLSPSPKHQEELRSAYVHTRTCTSTHGWKNFQTQPSVISEHEAHPSRGSFCSCTRALPLPRSRDTLVPGTSGCSPAAPPQPHQGFPRKGSG